MKTRVSDYIAYHLADLGATHVFLVTGGGAMHLNDAFGKCTRLKYVCGHHEQGCAIEAEGFARVADRPAIVNPTTGPGGINALTGVHGAWTDSLPMVVISGQVKQEHCVSSYPDIYLRQLGDQEVDIIRLATPITKYAVMLRDPKRVRYEVEKAYYLATNGRPGPCWIDVPNDIQAAFVETEELVGYTPEERPADVDKLTEYALAIAERIAAAKRPVILAGNGLRVGRARQEFTQLLETWAAPVVASRTAIDILPFDHPLYMGRSGVDSDRAGNIFLQNADLLVVLGSRLGIRQTGYNREAYARAAYVIHVDIDENELNKPTLQGVTDLRITVDLKQFLPILKATIAQKLGSTPDYTEWTRWGKEKLTRYYGPTKQQQVHTSHINPYGFLDKLFAKLRDDDVIACGNGAAFIMTSHVVRIKGNQRMFFNSGCASMGFDLPSAIGAAIARNGKRVICFAGDGSVQMNIQELQTWRHHNLNIILVVINNGGYLSIRTTQEGFFGFKMGESAETGVSFPNYTKVAEAYGLPSIRIDSVDFEGQLSEALLREGPLVIEVLVDPAQKFEPRLASKQLPSGKIVSPPLEDMYPHLDDAEMASAMIIPPVAFL